MKRGRSQSPPPSSGSSMTRERENRWSPTSMPLLRNSVKPARAKRLLVLFFLNWGNNLMPTESIKIRNFIDGQFTEPVGGKYLDNIEPATGKPYSQVADSDAGDVELAVAAAEKAFPLWAKIPAADRSRILLRIADFIERD